VRLARLTGVNARLTSCRNGSAQSADPLALLWNIGPLATGASLRGLFQLAVLIRRLRKLEVRAR
jgi:hypothetical protein